MIAIQVETDTNFYLSHSISVLTPRGLGDK